MTPFLGPLIERISCDHFQSAVLAVERCLQLGYRRIGLVLCEETSHRLEHRWLAGYRLAIERNNIEIRLPPLMIKPRDELAPAMSGWLSAHQPDVVLLSNAEFELQTQIPDTIGMVSLGVDKIDGAMSGIFQNYRLLGRLAAEHCVAKLYTSNFDPLEEARLHLVAGRWAKGVTAPGPHQRRLSAETLKAQRWSTTDRHW